MSAKKGFSFKNGVAINPEVKKVEDLSNTDRARFEKMDEKERLEEVYKFEQPYPEVKVTPEVRQEGFEAFVTTDDHLMHLTGIAKKDGGTAPSTTSPKIHGAQTVTNSVAT